MTECPTDSFFPYDYICTSFLTIFEQTITTHLLNYKSLLSAYSTHFPCNLSSLSSILSPNDPLSKMQSSFNFPQESLSFPTQHSFLTHISKNHELEYYLSQIKSNCFDVIANFDIGKDLMKLASIQKQLVNFSEDIITIKHLLFKNNCEYYGNVKMESETKHGFGCLIFNESELTYIGSFDEDAFTSGVIVDKLNKTVYKGKFINNETFSGLKMIYNLEDNKIEHFFFGTIEMKKSIHTGCSIKYIKSKKEENDNNDTLIKISYFHENSLTLSLEYLPIDIHRILLINKSTNSYIQYSNEGYLLEITTNPKNNTHVTQALLSKIDKAFYIGNIDIKLKEINGYGIVIYESGNYYKGNMRSNKKEGKGLFVNEKMGLKYEGEFSNDMLIHGVIINMNDGKFLYEGELQNMKPKKGKALYKNGDEYVGEFSEYTRNGNGVYTYSDGENGDKFMLECQWEKNVKKGPVVLNKDPRYRILFDEDGNKPVKVYDDSKEENNDK